MRTYTPIHEDTRLNEDWLIKNGFQLGTNAYYNAIRDSSGRYLGFVLAVGKEHYFPKTIEQAEEVLRVTQQQETTNDIANPEVL